MHHHGLARAGVMRRMKHVPCGEDLDRIGRALIEADVVGNRDHLRGARDHILGVGFCAYRRDPHADAESVDAFTDLLDDAGGFETRSIGKVRRLRVLALAEKRIGEVDADRAIANQHRAFDGLGHWSIGQLQHLGTAEFLELDLLHEKSPSFGFGPETARTRFAAPFQRRRRKRWACRTRRMRPLRKFQFATRNLAIEVSICNYNSAAGASGILGRGDFDAMAFG